MYKINVEDYTVGFEVVEEEDVLKRKPVILRTTIKKISVFKKDTDILAKNFIIDELIIPDIIEGIAINKISRHVFNNTFVSGTIKNLIIDDNISIIKASAFSCTLLTIKNCHWPKNCKIISENCFNGCKLENIEGIEDVERINKYAFEDTNIKHFDWPEKCTIIPEGCFCNSLLETINGLEHVKTIKMEAFGRTWIKKINLENVTQIGNGAFINSLLEEVWWSSCCNVIPSDCFTKTELKSIKNIEHVTIIGSNAFEKTNIDIFCWPEKCETIPVECFNDCNYLKEVKFKGMIKSISFHSFSGCSEELILNFTNIILTEQELDVIKNQVKGNPSILIKIPYYLM